MCVLLQARSSASADGGRLLLVASAPGDLRRLLKLTALHKLFEIADALPDALRRARSHRP
ncbi:hypothetical protein AB0395_34025 [Streptosporangium sp. NPDC051023]|uniref:hypothetical protein n=1 Tax=Streptosporangium sp. NPDC051023 TaxID=3155410 RepID=UPI00344C971C